MPFITNSKIIGSLLLTSVAVLSISSIQPSQAEDAPIASGRAKTSLETRGKFIDQRIAEFMAENNLPGLSMAIVQAPYIPRSAGYGRASVVNDQLASTGTMWNIGPITQGFTAVAVFQLYEAHKLDIHESITHYVPGLPSSWKKITVLELLQHATGIPDFRNSSKFKDGQAYEPGDLVAMVGEESLLFEPGTQVRQSATNFVLLGLAIEHASGMSFHDYVTKKQIEPLGLRSTMFASDFPSRSHLDKPAQDTIVNKHIRFKSEIPFIDPVEPAVGYRQVGVKLDAVEPKSSEPLFSFGSIWSSAEDISLWDIALAGSTLVASPDNRALIYESTKLPNGTVVPAMAGWEFTHHPGFMEVKGFSPGFSSYLSRFTAADELVCVTLLTNKEGVDLTDLARDIADSYLDGLGAPVPTGLVTQESKFGVDETVSRLEAGLKAMNIPEFALFDHRENAKQAELELRPTKVIVFGNAKVGTKLMLDNQAVALDLPLRVSVWEDGHGQVWVSYHNVDRLTEEFGIKDRTEAALLSHVLQKLVDRAVNVYAN